VGFMLWFDLGVVMKWNVVIIKKNMDNELGSTMLFRKGEKDLIVKGLVWYYINLKYGKFVEQFVIPNFYHELKVEFVAIKVNVLYHYSSLFRSEQMAS
jgi:hypothetical protein